jgi:hypothetical protein
LLSDFDVVAIYWISFSLEELTLNGVMLVGTPLLLLDLVLMLLHHLLEVSFMFIFVE